MEHICVHQVEKRVEWLRVFFEKRKIIFSARGGRRYPFLRARSCRSMIRIFTECDQKAGWYRASVVFSFLGSAGRTPWIRLEWDVEMKKWQADIEIIWSRRKRKSHACQRAEICAASLPEYRCMNGCLVSSEVLSDRVEPLLEAFARWFRNG